MTASNIIDGKAFSETLRARIAVEVAAFKAVHGKVPGLATVLVGDDPASAAYVRNKNRQTVEAGMHSVHHKLPAETSESDLLTLVRRLNQDDQVDGILVQLPLPGKLDQSKVIAAIDPEKDVDGLHVVNAGRLVAGLPAMIPCTPLGCQMLLKDRLGDMTGANAVVLGRSILVGKPMAQLLLAENCTVTMAHSRSRDLPAICRAADILVAAVGRPGLVRGDWVRPGAAVIDVGINRVEGPDGKGRLVGDVNFAEAAAHAGAITPVPGGVGPMTIACLLQNTLTAFRRRHLIAAA